ncbi:DUF6380 family protein [Streptomyces sp. NPDC090994]
MDTTVQGEESGEKRRATLRRRAASLTATAGPTGEGAR